MSSRKGRVRRQTPKRFIPHGPSQLQRFVERRLGHTTHADSEAGSMFGSEMRRSRSFTDDRNPSENEFS
jgi:hypothetical protein